MDYNAKQERLFEHFLKHTDERKHIKKFILESFPQPVDGWALDVGAGNGDLTTALKQRFSAVEAIEPNPRLFKSCCGVADSATQVKLEDFPLQRKYSFALLSHMLYYVDNRCWIEQIKRVANALEENGCATIIIVDENSDLFKFNQAFLSRDFNYLTPSALCNGLEAEGLVTNVTVLKPSISAATLECMTKIGEFLTLNYGNTQQRLRCALEAYFEANCKAPHGYAMSNEQAAITVRRA